MTLHWMVFPVHSGLGPLFMALVPSAAEVLGIKNERTWSSKEIPGSWEAGQLKEVTVIPAVKEVFAGATKAEEGMPNSILTFGEEMQCLHGNLT